MGELGRSDLPLAARDRHDLARRHRLDQPRRLGRTQRGCSAARDHEDVFRAEQVVSPHALAREPRGPAHRARHRREQPLPEPREPLGLAHELFGARLLPVGTLYDPFIARGLDALNYACYQDARFILVATPSGITLAPEGGAHQSIGTPLIGIGQPGLTSFEPAYADELAVIMRWAFEHLQARGRWLGLSAADHPPDPAAATRR